MLRLTLVAQTPQQAILNVDGQITADQVPLLAAEIGRLGQHSACLVLVLDGVAHIDPEGLELLKQGSGSPVRLRGGSPFVRALLSSGGLSLDQ